MSKEAESDEPAENLLRLLGGKWLAAAISAAASLGLADILARETLSLDDLASRIGCQPDGLQRLMRVLLGEGIVSLNATNQYELSEMGELLRKDELGELARFVGSPFSWDPWSTLAESIRTGESAFAKHHGLPLFEYLDHHREHAELYHHAIDAFSRREAQAVAEAYDFSKARRVADIGGGRGRLLIEVLSRWDHLTGVLFERPTAAALAAQALQNARLESRCEVRVGDFFEELPDDIDVCVLMHIIHSWDDETATRLLRRCADAVGPDGTLLIIEGLLVPGAHRDLTNLLDLEMLVLCGPGHERRKPEMRRLISAAGLRLHDAVPLIGGIRLLVIRPRSASGRDD